ncbi:MAG: 2-phospho-L-lactate transferase [Candidatus Nanopelagicales bacterium]|nr:2-phospho-L-lactate transferase [Candidatus Nanopelagicales bacterium]
MSATRRITVLAGGVGAARFLTGLVGATSASDHQPAAEITVVGNTADDLYWFGLKVCPDLDSVMYTLGGGSDQQRGWGRGGESFRVLNELQAYRAQPDWFGIGDLDLATHLVRTQALATGKSLTQATAELARRWELPVRLLPMTDDPVETHVFIRDPATDAADLELHFQEWWIRYRAEPEPSRFVFTGAESARPGSDVIAAIADADLVIFPPSNPVVSIGPILAVPGIRDAVAATRAPVVGVSPIIGSAPVRGMADRCLRAIGVPVSATGVGLHFDARANDGLLDHWVIDERDAEQASTIRARGLSCTPAPTLMSDLDASTRLARSVLELGGTP